MKINYNRIDYVIWWKYIRPNKNYNAKFQNEYTECHIEALAQGIQIITSANKVAGEIFCKDIGRKLSLKRALKQLFSNDKEARRFFWNRYLMRHLSDKEWKEINITTVDGQQLLDEYLDEQFGYK